MISKKDEFIRTTYEVIESYPTILRHEVPLLQILMGTFYFIALPFGVLYMISLKGFSSFKNIEFSKGAENNSLVNHFDLKTLESFKFSKGEVIQTESLYLDKRESIRIADELEKEGFSISDNIKGSFRLKRRDELCFAGTNESHENATYVIISVPKIAVSIHNVFNSLKLL